MSICCQCSGVPVVAGPTEATAVGNIMVQAISTGLVDSVSDARAIIRQSFELETYEPEDTEKWNSAYERFLAISGLS